MILMMSPFYLRLQAIQKIASCKVGLAHFMVTGKEGEKPIHLLYPVGKNISKTDYYYYIFNAQPSKGVI